MGNYCGCLCNGDQKKAIEIYGNCTDDNTPYFTYQDIRAVVKVVRIIDGDTVVIVMKQDHRPSIYKYRVRLHGIDTPESRPPLSQANREEEMAASSQSKKALQEKLMEVDYYVTIHFHHFDKYGRLLGTLYGKDGININHWMVKNHYAVAYDGKTKKAFDPAVQPSVQPSVPAVQPRTILSSINSH